MIKPLAEEIPFRDPLTLFSLLSHLPGSIFLDSNQEKKECGEYSFIGIDPIFTIKSKNGFITKNEIPQENTNPFDFLDNILKDFQLETIPSLPPFQGGIAGYFGYDLYQHLEKIPLAKQDDMQFPDLILGCYDIVIAFDVMNKKSWIFSSGFPFLNAETRSQAALDRLKFIKERINYPKKSDNFSKNYVANKALINKPIETNFSEEKYIKTIKNVIEFILAGDIFQANLTQRFITELAEDISIFDIYLQSRQINPAPFSAYLNFSDVILASASPERFIKLHNKHVEARPIKGTRARGKTEKEDKRLAEELLASEKDKAENVMIVDLLRNDLSKVCEPHSIHVPYLCKLESYATVHHLVSVIRGKLKESMQAIDLLKATFPGGSITGAPKVRAMEIITELEPTQRGPYCGSIGYIGFDGNMDTSITIRTFCIKNNNITFQSGGAIVADSNPEEEYQETLTKARALIHTLKGGNE